MIDMTKIGSQFNRAPLAAGPKPYTTQGSQAPTGPAAPGTLTSGAGAKVGAPTPSVGMNLGYSTPAQWGQASDFYTGQMNRNYQTNPYLASSLGGLESYIGGGGQPTSMADFEKAYNAKYGRDLEDAKAAARQSVGDMGLGNSSFMADTVGRAVGDVANQRALAFADKQTSLDEAARARVLDAMKLYGSMAGQDVSAQQQADAMRFAGAEGAKGVGDTAWGSLGDLANWYGGLSSGYNNALYGPSSAAYDQLLQADMGTTKPTTYDEGLAGRIGGVVGGVGQMIDNGYFKKRNTATETNTATGTK